MNIYHSLDSFQKLEYGVVTSGTFDGVHLGHKKILSRLREISEQSGGETVVLTFWPHPRTVVSEDSQGLQLLSTIDEKIELFSQLGIHHLLIVPFTRAFSELSSHEYIKEILVDKIGTKKLVIGYDHRFGRNREGSFGFLQDNCASYGFEVEEISREDIENMAVSSSRIRKALVTGHVEEANELLGRPYTLSGTVVKGKQLGRTIGFPTANVHLHESYKLIPMNGVYVIHATYNGEQFKGMLNIGVRPTVDGSMRTIEANLFDFDKEIYGEDLKLELLHYLRPEQKFESLDMLVRQINIDKENSLAHFS
ncbi:bifunctional riboflavin kinase/FAD synthetase [Dyadobacter chenwenxiniae]|uniref:Riboflavin biosynthesis protein n=1 Tax=Dyadobacter chenwenxiniae TaxID=2906456 RepID=A0A9X1PKR4_9BACT|nr:bifunctional riboflavin kinase/FAD synthetase [Dyadobacter chenwenxiniae]MCF0063137.1 bifunctional riboflavin kinase/FAD synthetase [Dyadobacter chenwenxiniae]UON84693.1 bifunctional riboflavin kinase/FAD synthetase [Dyadobacter chenwenxiniae]